MEWKLRPRASEFYSPQMEFAINIQSSDS